MSFKVGRRRGTYWDDCKELDAVINDFPFHTTGKNERDFEIGFATHLIAIEKMFNGTIFSQIDSATTVESVYCFGKSHRPDITIDHDGIAIEIKFITYEGLKNAIGQGFLYRLKYRFVFLVLVISEGRSKIYNDLHVHEERDMQDTLRYLAKSMNIFTYVVPTFKLNPGTKKCISFFI